MVEHVNEHPGMYYDVQASLSSLVRPIFLYRLSFPFLVYIGTRRGPISAGCLDLRSFILVIFGQHDAYPLASRPYPQTHTHSSPHSSCSGFTPLTHSNTPASDTGESLFRHGLNFTHFIRFLSPIFHSAVLFIKFRVTSAVSLSRRSRFSLIPG
ncbi:hypothetical protein OG21DRAFT_849321 [Imleria badia]|nr:hypothetical protein OG21DRAFT_849321 [Imleria badia]